MNKLHLPVTVLVGRTGSRNLHTVEDLIDFLDEWPPARRGPLRENVYRCCLAALAREGSEAEAREAFVAFARLLNVLEPTFDTAPEYDTEKRNSAT